MRNIGYYILVPCGGAGIIVVHPQIHCDKFKISQVIRNLISNALKFTPADGEVSIRLELVEDSENNEQRPDFAGTIRITVRDSGAGISVENQKKMSH